LEKKGTFTNVKGRVQRFYPAVPAPGDVQPEWQTLLKVLQGISDVPASIKGVESLFNWMAEETSELEGLTWDALGDTGADIEL
jgi:predicted molibdopterin-dependent oxidoreductase YjgC